MAQLLIFMVVGAAWAATWSLTGRIWRLENDASAS
jgi:hypothetical protein